jgi:hypothetical protein
MKIKSFKEFLNEFELEGEHHEGKPLWNGIDYLNEDGDIYLARKGLTELPCIFPEELDGNFYCSNNKLTSLYGSPKKVKGGFYCRSNRLTSLEGAPKVVGGDFFCNFNPVKFTTDDVRKICNVGGGIYV